MRTSYLRAGPIVGTALAAAAVILVAALVRTEAGFALQVSVLLAALGFALLAPSLIFAATFAGVYAYWRVGPAEINMSLSDALTVLAVVAAVPYAPWNSPTLRRILSALFFYLGLVLITVGAHPSGRAVAEWLHRGVIVGGAVIVGAAIAHRGQIAMALRAFLSVSAIVAVAAIVDTLTKGLTSAYPFGMHKNSAGPLLAAAAIVLIVAPSTPRLSHSVVRYLRLLVIAGLFATQSRGAGLALVAVIAIWAVRHARRRFRAPLLFLCIAVALVVVSVTTLQSETVENPEFNAVVLREATFDYAINNVWEPSPLAGGGLRWFVIQQIDLGVPHNLVIAELSETGLLGLLGLGVLTLTTLRVLYRRRDPIGEAAFYGFVFILLFGLTGIFWVAGSLTLPMLLVGLAAGTQGSVSERARSAASGLDEPP
jgi:O-antigen ligase